MRFWAWRIKHAYMQIHFPVAITAMFFECLSMLALFQGVKTFTGVYQNVCILLIFVMTGIILITWMSLEDY